MLIDRGNHVKAETLGNVDMSQSMGFNLNANSFELILKNLYQDPTSAMIRELCTNAYEANQASGTDKKVLIQLPNLLNNDLIIKDFGKGLDYDEVMKYLNVLFSSSKSTDKDALGGFGLGSKSPLALVDSFYLSSVKDGKEYSFIWVKEGGSVPTPIYNGFTETDAPSGITVTVPLSESSKINQSNITNIMVEAARKALLGFKNEIKIVEDITVDYDEAIDLTSKILNFNFVLEQEGYSLFEKNETNRWFSNDPDVFVRVGTVTYPSPVNYRTLISKTSINSFEKLVENFSKFNLIIDVPPSTLDIPMSREYLENNDNNLKVITKSFLNFQEKFEQYFKSLNIDLDVGIMDFEKIKKNKEASKDQEQGLNWRISLSYETAYKHDKEMIDTIDKIILDLKKSSVNATSTFFSSVYNKKNPSYTILQCLKVIFESLNISLFDNYTSKLTHNNKDYLDMSSLFIIPESLLNSRTVILIKFLKEQYPDNNFTQTYLLKNTKALPRKTLETLLGYLSLLAHVDYNFVEDLDDVLQKYNDFKKTIKKDETIKVTNEEFAGVYSDIFNNCNIQHNSYSSQDSYCVSTGKRIKKIVNATGTTIPLGSSYFSEDNVILITSKEKHKLPIKMESLTHIVPDNLKENDNVRILIVPERSFNITLTRLIKDGFNVFTQENPYSFKIPSLEDFVIQDKSEENMMLLFYTVVRPILFNFLESSEYLHWRFNTEKEKTLLSFFKDCIKKLRENGFDLYADAFQIVLDKDKTIAILTKHYNSSSLGLDKENCLKLQGIIEKLILDDLKENDLNSPIYFKHIFRNKVLSEYGFSLPCNDSSFYAYKV